MVQEKKKKKKKLKKLRKRSLKQTVAGSNEQPPTDI
tara:strand:- start:3750 stop:3857 length:108 start_codon:yes stop_codon:yes gene_type:complete